MRYPYSGQRQIKVLDAITLATITGAGTGGAKIIEWRAMTPDSRLQVKTTVLFSPTPPFTFPFDITTLGASLYIAAEDECFGGPFSGYVPITALVGTQSAPLALPNSPDLLGYSQEFVTAADAIHGFLTLNTGAEAVTGTWVLQVRYQPAGQRLPDLDWEETYQLCNASPIGGARIF